MVTALVTVILLLVVAAGVVGFFLDRRRQQQELRERFGSEYDRVLDETGDRRRGERALLDRQKRHERLDIRPVDPDRARDYRAEWELAQTRFVDDPAGAIGDAGILIEALMSERGYPVGDFDTKVEDLSVQHSDVLQHYRAAHKIAAAADQGRADTESLRRAIVHYRALFAALLDDGVHKQHEAQTTRRTR